MKERMEKMQGEVQHLLSVIREDVGDAARADRSPLRPGSVPRGPRPSLPSSAPKR